MTIINAKPPFFSLDKDDRLLKNVNHFYPQNFSYFTARPDSLISIEAFEITKDNDLKKINTSLSHSSNYYGLSRINRFNYQFFGILYNYIPDENQYHMDDSISLNHRIKTQKRLKRLHFGKSFFAESI